MPSGDRRLIPLRLRRWIRSLIDTLPSPRDQALKVTLQSALDFLRGRPPPHADSEYSARLGWEKVDVYERLGQAKSRELLTHELNAWFAAAKRIPDLMPWSGLPAGYPNDNNRLRFKRTVDFIMSGDRVFDVGFGKGYLGGLILRDSGAIAYHAIDVVDRFLPIFQSMVTNNGFQDRDLELAISDLFDLTPERLARSDPTLVVCCEVMEHLTNPEAALTHLAEIMPDHCHLLFSVPLHGRLESVWGHLTVFDVHRLRSMLEEAGLIVQHVEPVANQWTFVLASKDGSARRRAERARSKAPMPRFPRLVDRYDFVTIPPDELSATSFASARVSAEPAPGRRTKAIVGPPSPDSNTSAIGGLSFPVPSLTALRIDVFLEGPESVERVMVDLLAGREIASRWQWEPQPGQLADSEVRRFSFRPGRPSLWFEAKSTQNPEDEADTVRVLLQVAPGQQGAIAMRAAYLP